MAPTTRQTQLAPMRGEASIAASIAGGVENPAITKALSIPEKLEQMLGENSMDMAQGNQLRWPRIRIKGQEFVLERWVKTMKKTSWIQDHGIYLLHVDVLEEEGKLAMRNTHWICRASPDCMALCELGRGAASLCQTPTIQGILHF